MDRPNDCKIVLETGEVYEGKRFGARRERVLELVFNTSMVGYQEIISDPSYACQAVVMTYPVIGNYGITDEDFETETPAVGALIVRDYTDRPSNFRSTRTLGEILEDCGIPGVTGVDTRGLARRIRDGGCCRALVCDADTDYQTALQKVRSTPVPKDVVASVSCRKRRYSRTAHARSEIVALDLGIKQNMIRSLNKRGCNVTVLPHTASAEEIAAIAPDGVFISNGPGNPEDVPAVVALIREIRGKYPVFGVCLGHQLIALAYGGQTYKLKFGHRGGNHPVKNLATGKVEITSQNHSYAVMESSLAATPLRVTHVNILDGTVEGVECKEDRIFGVQYHPESAPGPQDSGYLFDKFVRMAEENRAARMKDMAEENRAARMKDMAEEKTARSAQTSEVNENARP